MCHEGCVTADHKPSHFGHVFVVLASAWPHDKPPPQCILMRIVGASAVLHAIWNIKPRLLRHGSVANPRDTYGYRCGLRLALTQNPSFLFVPSSVQHYTRALDFFT